MTQQQDDQHALQSAVAIEERVYGLKLDMRKRRLADILIEQLVQEEAGIRPDTADAIQPARTIVTYRLISNPESQP